MLPLRMHREGRRGVVSCKVGLVEPRRSDAFVVQLDNVKSLCHGHVNGLALS